MADYTSAIRRAARRHGVSPRVLLAQLRQESGLNPDAVSGAGAKGIAQFIPSTAKAYGVNLNDGNPMDDIDGAARFMADLLARNHGSYKQALSAYNSGNPNAYKDPSFAKGQTFNYVKNILGAAGSPSDSNASSSQRNHPTPGRKVTIPGKDRSVKRQQLGADYISNSHNPDALIQYAVGLQQNQDGPTQVVTLGGGGGSHTTTSSHANGGTANFEGHQVAGWIKPALQYARSHGWGGEVNSGFRSKAEQTRIYNSGVRPAAKPGTSNHEGSDYPRGAVDVSDAAQLSKILSHSRFRNKLKWAGSKDPVHFSHPHNGSY